MSGRSKVDVPARGEVEQAACRVFAREFVGRPSWLGHAPGRVNLIGEHTDYTGGLVCPMAIGRWCVAVGRLRNDRSGSGTTRVYSEEFHECVEIEPRLWTVDGPSRGSWESYVIGVMAGLAAEARSEGRDVLPSVEIALVSTVPRGAGLSSSAAIETSVAMILMGLWGLDVSAARVAHICQSAEHEFAGVPCGIMDQTIVSMGTAGHALLINCESGQTRQVLMPLGSECAVVVCDTGVKHALASGEYATRREWCEGAARVLGVKRLRHATAGMLRERGRELTDEQRRAATHVVSENERVAAFVACMEAGDLVSAGRLMIASHASLRDVLAVSCDELDCLVSAACGVPEVYGSRMTGGGFGGSTVTLCRADAVGGVSAAMERAYRGSFKRECRPFVTAAVDGAGSVRLGDGR